MQLLSLRDVSAIFEGGELEVTPTLLDFALASNGSACPKLNLETKVFPALRFFTGKNGRQSNTGPFQLVWTPGGDDPEVRIFWGPIGAKALHLDGSLADLEVAVTSISEALPGFICEVEGALGLVVRVKESLVLWRSDPQTHRLVAQRVARGRVKETLLLDEARTAASGNPRVRIFGDQNRTVSVYDAASAPTRLL